jgi:hypothetical protein
MNQLLQIVIAICQKAGVQLPAVWPHLTTIGIELYTIATILNNGKPLAGAAPLPSSNEVQDVKKLAQQHGVPENQVDDLLTKTHAAGERLTV